MDKPIELNDIKGFIRRRKKVFLLIFFTIFLASVVIAFTLPPVYKATATIKIEDQQIPDEYVKSTITTFVEERLHAITNNVLNYKRLKEIVKEMNLYPEMRDKYPFEVIMKKFRDSMTYETISTNVMDRNSRKARAVTVAFSLSYEGSDPETVKMVTERLAELYIEEDIKTREKLAAATTDFFEEESESLKQQIREYEQKISIFKNEHIGELPEYSRSNFQALSRLERDLDNVTMRLRSLEEKKIYLKSQLATIDPLLPIVTEKGKTAQSPKERLKRLRLTLISLQATLSDKHPDIRKLKREINELESKVGSADDTTLKLKRIEYLKAELAEKRGKLGDTHPDIVRISKEIKMLEAETDRMLAEKADFETAGSKPDNPTYINLMTQITSADIEIKNLLEDQKKIEADIAEYNRKTENMPYVEKEFFELTRDYETAKTKYREISSKIMAAKIAQGMEKSQKGERFIITNPPYTPEQPYKPNRLAVALLGFILAFGTALTFVSVQEAMDHSVKNEDELYSLTGIPVFSVIPFAGTDRKSKSKRFLSPAAHSET